jgi:hypothetical protein
MFRSLCFLVLFAAIGAACWYGWQNYDELIVKAEQLPSFGRDKNIITFEACVTADEIMQKHQKELLRDANHTFGQVSTKYLPLVLFDVKYTKEDKKTEEGRLLWSLENGEMVLNTANFDMTRGFEDFINAKAQDDDFRLIQVLLKHGGTTSKELFFEELGMDSDQAISRLEALRNKHLVTVRADSIRLHFASPVLKVSPETAISHNFVTKSADPKDQIASKYSRDAVRRIAYAAFRPDFAIRGEQPIFVPIIEVDVKNPDGSTLKTFWNGVTGKKTELARLR